MISQVGLIMINACAGRFSARTANVVSSRFWLINNKSRGYRMRIRELEASIRRTMRQHYGWNIGSFRDSVSDNVGNAPFVASLVRVITGRPDTPDLDAPHARATERDKETWPRLREMRLERGINAEEFAHRMGVHEEFLEALEDGHIVTLMSLPCDYLQALELRRDEKRSFCDWMFSDDLREIKLDGHMRARGAGPAQSIRGVIEKYYERNLWQFRPEFTYEESIRPFVSSLLELSAEYRATSRAMKDLPARSIHMGELLERTKADADRKGVHWMVHIAQQDAGMADILSRMAESALTTANREA
jgi:transcriptional regulator with XRE-family HTH domain